MLPFWDRSAVQRGCDDPEGCSITLTILGAVSFSLLQRCWLVQQQWTTRKHKLYYRILRFRIRSNRYRSAQMRMSCSSFPVTVAPLTYAKLPQQPMLLYHKWELSLVLFNWYLFSILLDIVLECDLEGTNHPAPSTMNLQIFSAEQETSKVLILKKMFRLVWKHYGCLKL